MELGTFGAILSFAIDWEEQAAAYYEVAAPEPLSDAFAEMAKEIHKRVKRLERARREGVAEMILESITGLDSDTYQVDFEAGADAAGRLHQAEAWEDAAARFYRAAAAKLPIREIVRLFERLAEENDQRRAKLAALKRS